MDHTASSVPAFINKLWMLVEDESTNDFIEWSEGGTSFRVNDQTGFAKSVLPRYFKHNNMASFVRQLNMYGFRKVSYPEQGGMRYEGDSIEFHHPDFQQGKLELLDQIKRKGTSKEEIKIKTNDVNKVLSEVQELKGKQEDMDSRLMSIKRENEGLWQEVITLRQKHRKQQQVVHRLIQFLMSIIPQRPVKRKRPLMIQNSAINPKIRKQIPSFEPASSSNSPAFQSTVPVSNQNLMLSEVLSPLDETADLGTTEALPLVDIDFLQPLPSVEGPAATLTEVTEPIVQSPAEIPALDSLITEDTFNSDVPPEIELPVPLTSPVETNTSNGDKDKTSDPGFTLALQRPLSVDEHKQELSDHVENVQTNIDFIHELLTKGEYSLDPETLLPVFYPDPANITFDKDFLSKLGMPEEEEQPTFSTGNELVQYQPSSINYFNTDQDSLLSSLMNSGDASASDDGSTKDNELAFA
ncbi:heat shock factor protein-like [Anneissia japonica]|uniref:heat shock factor protein-like n=1 Tax=Anneissia japonica TaxID=1529436 RepID=UPI001425ACC5|nr:heat shock factor protein-like [Anneissia japonica]